MNLHEQKENNMNTQKLVGVDTHKDSLACYKENEFKSFPTTSEGFLEALRWAGDAKWMIEGAYCFGRPFSAFLIKNGNEVYEVNPLLTKTWRSALAVSNPKNDYGDAKVISLLANPSNTQKVSLKTIHLKEKLSARELLVKQKTELTNSIKMLYAARGEDLPLNNCTTKKAICWLEQQSDIVVCTKVRVLKEILAAIAELDAQIIQSLPEKAKRLKTLKGISDITAAVIYTETKGKLLSAAKLASYTGVAPVECSSGRISRHRNNKSGNRRLNSVFYRLSIAQRRFDENAGAYYEKKLSEGKSPRHARKSLSRQLVRISSTSSKKIDVNFL